MMDIAAIHHSDSIVRGKRIIPFSHTMTHDDQAYGQDVAKKKRKGNHFDDFRPLENLEKFFNSNSWSSDDYNRFCSADDNDHYPILSDAYTEKESSFDNETILGDFVNAELDHLPFFHDSLIRHEFNHSEMSMETVDVPVAIAVPTCCDENEFSISISVRDGVGGEYQDFSISESDTISKDIKDCFGIKDCSKQIVLRSDDTGCLIPISVHMPAGKYTLSTFGSQQLMSSPGPEKLSDKFSLQWIQQPPHGLAHWLSAHISKKTAVTPVQHILSPAVELGLASSFPGDKHKDILKNVKVRLYSASFEDVSQFLHQGKSEIYWNDTKGMMAVRFPEMAISEISRNHFSARTGVSSVQQEASSVHKRGACGWYHIKVELIFGNQCTELWLRDGKGDFAKLVVKHKRCAQTGGWISRQVGPYADHSRCTPSHVDSNGKLLCCSC